MTGSIGVNLEALSYYGRGLLYADALLSGQNWYQGSDASGNPTVSGSQIIVWEYGTPGMSGAYQFQATGKCTPGIGLTTVPGASITNIQYNAAANQTTATFTIPPGPWPASPFVAQMGLRLDWAATPPINVSLWRPGSAPGDLFYKPYLDLLAPFSCLRFMDLLKTNNSTIATFDSRPLPTDRNFTLKGAPLEHCVSLCHQAGKSGWIEVPFLIAANPVERKKFAAWLAANITAKSAQWYAVEVSNEDWNSMFQQWSQDQAAAAADPSIKPDGMGDPNILGWREYASICVGMSQDIMAAYGVSDWRQTPIRPVLGFQTGNTQVAQYEIDWVVKQFGPLAQFFFAGIEAPYVGPNWNLPTDTPANMVAALQTAAPAGSNTVQIDAWCRANGIHHLCYEFGFDFGQNPANAAVRAQAQQLPQIGASVLQSLASWASVSGKLACWYSLTYLSGNSGDWGLVEDIFSPDAPKYQAAITAAPLMRWDDRPLPNPAAAPAPLPAAPLFSGSFADSAARKLNITVTEA